MAQPTRSGCCNGSVQPRRRNSPRKQTLTRIWRGEPRRGDCSRHSAKHPLMQPKSPRRTASPFWRSGPPNEEGGGTSACLRVALTPSSSKASRAGAYNPDPGRRDDGAELLPRPHAAWLLWPEVRPPWPLPRRTDSRCSRPRFHRRSCRGRRGSAADCGASVPAGQGWR